MGGMGVPEIIVILAIFSIPLFIVALIIGYLRSAGRRRERLAAIEKGVAFSTMADTSTAPLETRVYLLRGLIWLCVGIALTLALLGISLTSKQPEYQVFSATTDGTETGNHEASNNIPMVYAVPPGVSFLGFIPIGVGIAYLSFHRMETRRGKGV
jgi:hypothetical protein